MEYKFLDSKLPVDLTNLIASFVGPKNKTHVKEINSLYKRAIDEAYYYKYIEYENAGVEFISEWVEDYVNNETNIINDFQKLKLKRPYPVDFWDDL